MQTCKKPCDLPDFTLASQLCLVSPHMLSQPFMGWHPDLSLCEPLIEVEYFLEFELT